MKRHSTHILTGLISALLLLSISCTRTPYRVSFDKFEKYSDRVHEKYSFEIVGMLGLYRNVYGEFPKHPKQIIHFIEDLNRYEPSIVYYWGVYDQTKRNWRNIIIETKETSYRSIIEINYKKSKSSELKGVAKLDSYTNTDKDIRPVNGIDLEIFKFDKKGRFLGIDGPATDSVSVKHLREIYQREYPHDSTAKYTYMQYTPNKLQVRDTGEELDVGSSVYLQQAYNYLDSLAQAQELSKISVAAFIEP